MGSSWRMALQYVLIFAGTGVSLPFAGLWLAQSGLDGARIGAVLAAPMLGRVITGPLLAVWADGFKRRRTPMALLGLVAAFGYALAGLGDGFWVKLTFWFVGATAASTLVPLTDVLTLRLADREGFAFALVRAAGSAAFVAANVGMGLWLVAAPSWIVIAWASAISLGLALCAALVLPAEPVGPGETSRGLDRFKGLGRLLTDRVFMTAIVAVGLIQAAHAFHYAFSAVLWKGQGIGEATTGLLWAFGVVVEIGFMALIEPWRRQMGVGPWALLIAAGVAAVVRWSAMAFAPPLLLLWPLQALHAFTFAASFLAGVQLVQSLAPGTAQTAGQMLASVLSAGLLIGLATIASGPLLQRFGFGGYWAMAVMGLIGLAAALPMRGRFGGALRRPQSGFVSPPA